MREALRLQRTNLHTPLALLPTPHDLRAYMGADDENDDDDEVRRRMAGCLVVMIMVRGWGLCNHCALFPVRLPLPEIGRARKRPGDVMAAGSKRVWPSYRKLDELENGPSTLWLLGMARRGRF